MPDRRSWNTKVNLYLAGKQIGKHRRTAAVWHMGHVDAGHHFEQLARYVGPRPIPGRRHVELVRIGLGVGNELGNRLCRNRWVDEHDVRLAINSGHRGDVADEIEIALVVERGIARVGGVDQEKRVTICRCTHHRLSAYDIAASRPVLDDELLTKSFRQPLRYESCDGVIRATGSGWYDDAYWPSRIALRHRDPRHGQQRRSTRDQMQKSPAGKFHKCSPPIVPWAIALAR